MLYRTKLKLTTIWNSFFLLKVGLDAILFLFSFHYVRRQAVASAKLMCRSYFERNYYVKGWKQARLYPEIIEDCDGFLINIKIATENITHYKTYKEIQEGRKIKQTK